MNDKRIKFVIESRLENVSLVGVAINRLCSLIPLSDVGSYQIELCAVEAVTNSIKHAYGEEAGHDVEVVFTLKKDRIALDVYDTGKPLNPTVLQNSDFSCHEIAPKDIAGLPIGGRGIAIIKEIMDDVEYRTANGKNCFSMTKKLDPNPDGK